METILLQLDPNLLSVTGVIATVLAVIFALGAFNNSRSRKKHMLEMEKAQKQEHSIHFRPAKSHLPGRSNSPGRSSAPKATSSSESTPRAAPIAKSSSLPKEESEKKASDKQVLFRKVRPDGLDQQIKADDDEQETYVWE
jgi:hypothetical protein